MRHFGSIDKYEILEPLEESRTFSAYRAVDRESGTLIRLCIAACGGPELYRRFLEAVDRARRLEHPAVARVLGCGRSPQGAFLVQAWPRGETLAELLRRSDPVPVPVALRWLGEIAAGLEAAHDAGLLHLGLRPASIAIDGATGAQVLDFAISALGWDETLATETPEGARQLAYRSPEQLEARAVDRRSDVFSFGAVAYEMLGGVRPFPGSRFSELLHQISETVPPPLTRRRPEMPRVLSELVARCLEKEPERRFEDFGSVLEALGRPPAGSRKANPASPVRAGAARPRLLAAMAATLAVLAVVVGMALWQRRGDPGPPPAPPPPPPPAAAAGQLVVDATPWGTVDRIVGPEDVDVEVPADAVTPLVLRLSPGEYRVELSGPAGTEPRSCRATVQDGSVRPCRVEFLALGPTDYFRETGWWN